MDTALAIKFFGALFAIMNPFTNLPIFLGVTEGATRAVQRQIAIKTIAFTLIMGAIIAVAGSQVLRLFGISIDDFRVAGGLVVLLIGLNMLNGKESSAHHGTTAEQTAFPDPASVAFYPMTFPMLVGPGTITTLILFTHQATSWGQWLSVGAVFLVVVAILGLVLFFAGNLGAYLSATARVIMTRVMGMILAAIAVDMIASGLKTLLPGLG
ncbi:MarC family protein [Sedimentitalea sp. HM32M-2]|uniref:MarC family protein n=1 Tax=Sedimentitalea sp. HM32M-2 TaxID=3351566 RepID=UPI003641EACF